MGLVTFERDDEALLRIEDEAIMAAVNPRAPDAALTELEWILSGEPTPVHERTEGGDRPAG